MAITNGMTAATNARNAKIKMMAGTEGIDQDAAKVFRQDVIQLVLQKPEAVYANLKSGSVVRGLPDRVKKRIYVDPAGRILWILKSDCS